MATLPPVKKPPQTAVYNPSATTTGIPAPLPRLSPQEELKQKMWQASRAFLKREFAADPAPGGLRFAFQANISMMLHDRYGIDVAITDDMADNVIKLAFEDTYY